MSLRYSSGRPMEDTSPSHFPQKKILAIKKSDAEMLTRLDIQYDLLHYLFSEPSKVFTSQSPELTKEKVTFGTLYVNALSTSSKCSKSLKDKMKETPAFAIEFAKIALLANVGRINTTMAFFPEMKTALRTYHPVPSLQKTDGNLQDAPRIKNCLKAALLPSEVASCPPTTIPEIMGKSNAGLVPPTAIVNLLFVMSNSVSLLGRAHFEPPLDFADLFLPVNIPSDARGRAFLWLIFHYLEDRSSPNPFADDYANANPGKLPVLPILSSQEMCMENIDLAEEINLGTELCAQRSNFLKKLVHSVETAPRFEDSFKQTQAFQLLPRRPRAPRQLYHGDGTQAFRHYNPNISRQLNSIGTTRIGSCINSGETPKKLVERSMLQHAFHVVSTTDPLADSDEENDEHVRLDYNRRLQILNRLRGKTPTPLTSAQSTQTLSDD